jgi:hypothetical protein
MVVVDGLFFGFLVRSSGPRSLPATLWLLGPLLLGPLFLERFDLVAAAAAACGLGVLRRRPAVSAGLLTCAAAVKLWPAVMLGLFHHTRRDTRRAAVTAGGVALIIVAVSAASGFLPAFWTAFEQQRDRGLQVEAIAALPFSLAAAPPAYRHGSWEVTARGAGPVAVAVSLVGLAVKAGLLLRWRRLAAQHLSVDPAIAGTALTAVLLVFDKALSPQYMIWLLACLAVASTHRFRHRTSVSALTVTACALTHAVYPLQYTALLHGSVAPAMLLAGRNVLLIVIMSLLVHASWCPAEPGRLGHRSS